MSENDSLFEKTIKELIRHANADGKITPEELDIIEQVKIDADSYNMILQEALDDGMINQVEAKQLTDLKQAIIDRAELIAKVDGHLDSDEASLLQKLTEILKVHYSNKF